MTALINSGFNSTFGRTTINLAPADVRKEGPGFDLPIAIGMVAASEQIESDQLENFMIVGELALDGGVRPVKGVLPIALRARAEGKVGVLVAPENAAEAAVVAGLQVIPVHNLREATSFLEGQTTINPTPGEISLAHHGVLFLDELPQFKRSVLETLRQPLEEGHVTISRAAGAMTFPSQFMLVAAMNPTPDGKMPGESSSTPRDIQRYLGRISGPLLDRIDLHVEVPAVKFREITGERTGETSAAIRERVIAARQRQQERFKHKPKITCNARMGSRELKQFCPLDEATLEMLKFAMADLNFSARAYDRILKVARTIADLAGAENLLSDHISEAIQYRSLDRQLWT